MTVRPSDVGDLVDAYALERRVASTAVFEVWAGVDRRLDRPVHVRLLHPDLNERAGVVDALRQATRAAAGTSHPNLVAIIDVGTIHGRFCVVSESVARALSDTASSWSPVELDRAVAGWGAGLAAAHAAGQTHGDVRAEALFVAADGTAKIAEVGAFSAACAAAPDLAARRQSPAREGESDQDADIGALRTAVAAARARATADGDQKTVPIVPTPPAAPAAPAASIPRTRRHRHAARPRRVGSKLAPFALLIIATVALLAVALLDTDDSSPVPATRSPAHADLPPEIPR